VKIALAQINPTVGDFTGNLEKIVAVSRRAAALGARLTVFSELALCGYPPADFLEKPSFLARCRAAVDELASATRELPTAVLAGVALPAERESGKPAINAAVLLDGGRLLLEQHKRLLPFYDVFDEQRYFAPSQPQKVVELDGLRLAITICEDAWNDKNFWPRRLYAIDPVEELMRQQPAVLINLSSSPFWHGKRALRRQMLSAIARRDGVPVLLSNQVGGNDSLIFDGSSMALNARGELIAQASSFEEDLIVVDPFNAPVVPAPEEDDTEAAYRALVLGTRDYVRKCGFKKALVALSGGIDSALVAAIATEALGAENVLGIGMPSPYSSAGSIDDSRELAANLGIRFEVIALCGNQPRHHRGEHPVQDSRLPAHGSLQQVLRAGAHHRQQIGDGRGLLHPLRRHGRRAGRHRRPGQDPRLRRLPLDQPGQGSHSPLNPGKAALRRVASGPEGYRLVAPL
jgi:predicted amidohydrolase